MIGVLFQRHEITFGQISREAIDVDTNIVNDWNVKIKRLIWTNSQKTRQTVMK